MKIKNKSKTLIVTADISKKFKEFIKQRFGDNVEFAITTPSNITKFLSKEFKDELNYISIEKLNKETPKYSAKFLFKGIRTKAILIIFFIISISIYYNSNHFLAISFILSA